MNMSSRRSRLGPGSILLSISARLVSVSSLAMQQIPDATASRHLWYATLWCFLRNTDSGVDEFLYTALLSQNISVGPSTGTPNILNFYLSAVTSSTAFFNAVNSEPKVDDSAEFCLFLNQSIGARLQNISIPVCERLVTLSTAWLSSTNQCVVMILPLGFGISSGIASLESAKTVSKSSIGKTFIVIPRKQFLMICQSQEAIS